MSALQTAIEALEEIALAGMSGTGQETEEGMQAWHARRAWEFIGIAARALEKAKEERALEWQQPAGVVVEDMGRKWGHLQADLPPGSVLYAAPREVEGLAPVAWRVRRREFPDCWIIFWHEPVDAMKDPEREVQPLYCAPEPAR